VILVLFVELVSEAKVSPVPPRMISRCQNVYNNDGCMLVFLMDIRFGYAVPYPVMSLTV